MLRHALTIALVLLQIGGGATVGGKATIGGVAPSVPATITRVSQDVCGNQTIGSNIATCTLGTTVTSGNLTVVFVVGQSGNTLTGATAFVGGTPTSMTSCFNTTPDRDVIGLFYLPNSTAFTSIQSNWTGSNANTTSMVVAEYHGLSPTATCTPTPVTAGSGFVSTNTWGPTSSYTVAANQLLLSGTAANTGSTGVWGAGAGYTLVASDSTGGANTNLMMEEDISPAAGGYVGTGTLSVGSGGTHYDFWIGAFQ